MEFPSTTLVRPALELAWAVARAGERRRPPVPVPGPLRPLVRFARLPDRALETVRQVVDDDDAFRLRVGAAADEDILGRLPWLWLTRPEGWEAEVGTVAAASEAQLQVEEDRRADRAAQRRLAVVEASLQRTEGELMQARTAAAALDAELAELRTERRTETDAASRDRAGVLAAAEAREVAELRASDAEVRRLEVEVRLQAAVLGKQEADEASRHLRGQLDMARRELEVVGRAQEAELGRSAAAASALGGAVAEAAAAAERLGHALARAAEIIEGGASRRNQGRAVPAGRSRPVSETPGADKGPRRPQAASPAPAAPPARRVPVRLPAAVFDDSAEAASWLVRLPGAVLIVDGYNVTLGAWSGRELPDQRHRLVTAMAELSMRAGVDVEVVFDGADDHDHPLRSSPMRRPVRVVFSPPTVEADEVIIERVSLLPLARPVIVATDDRRVREAVHRAGANLLTTRQLVGVLGRTSQKG